MSELREIMRVLRNDSPSKVDVNASPPEVRVRLVWADLAHLEGEGVAKCHPRDTFDLNLGVTIAYGRAIKDAAQRLLDDFGGDRSPAVTKTLGDYIPCDEQEAFTLDGEDYAGDDGPLEDLTVQAWRLQDELDHLEERLAELEAGDGRRA